jgi:hypothetical protein
MSTYHSARLHAQHQRIGGQVARVGQSVLLPELGQEGLRAGEAVVVQHEVALEDDVDGARWEEINLGLGLRGERGEGIEKRGC